MEKLWFRAAMKEVEPLHYDKLTLEWRRKHFVLMFHEKHLKSFFENNFVRIVSNTVRYVYYFKFATGIRSISHCSRLSRTTTYKRLWRTSL